MNNRTYEWKIAVTTTNEHIEQHWQMLYKMHTYNVICTVTSQKQIVLSRLDFIEGSMRCTALQYIQCADICARLKMRSY